MEHAIRPTSLRKKNWLFFGDADARPAPSLYTIVESCRGLDIDPYVYLRNALTRLPSMTNRQAKYDTSEAWAIPSRSAVTAT
jgi:transposase